MALKKKEKYNILAWVACGLGALFYSYEYLLRISPSVMEGALRGHYQLSAGKFGALSAFYYYAYVPMQIPVGILMDRYGPRRLLTLACLICALGSYFFAATPWFWVAALGRFLVGLGSAFAFVGVLKIATLWMPEDKLGMIAGIAAALGTVGAMVGDNLLGFLVQQTSWQQTVHYTALFGIGLTVCLWLWLKDKEKSTYVADDDGLRIDKMSFEQSLFDLKLIASNSQIWLTGFYGCLVYLPTTVMAELWGIPYLHHAHNLSQSSADFGNSVIFLGFTFGAPFMGWWSDKIGRRILPMRVGALGALVMSVTILFMPNLSVLTLYCCLFLLGAFYSSQAISFAVGREASPKHAAGIAMAFTNMIIMLGGVFLQPLVGWLLDVSVHLRELTSNVALAVTAQVDTLYIATDYQFALLLLPVGIFVAFVLTFFINETHAHVQK